MNWTHSERQMWVIYVLLCQNSLKSLRRFSRPHALTLRNPIETKHIGNSWSMNKVLFVLFLNVMPTVYLSFCMSVCLSVCLSVFQFPLTSYKKPFFYEVGIWIPDTQIIDSCYSTVTCKVLLNQPHSKLGQHCADR